MTNLSKTFLVYLKNQLTKSTICGGVVIVMIVNFNIKEVMAQNVQEHQTDHISGSANEAQSGSGSAPGNSGEVIAARSPVLSSYEPSCEELRAMWR